MKFEFRVCPSQVTKPAFPEEQEVHEKQPEKYAQPESDIDNGEPGYHIANVNGTHRLIFNKYCIYRPQYILLTTDPLLHQTSPLGVEDFAAALTVLDTLEGHHYVIFNCAKPAGGSRMHKHMQIFEQLQDELLPDLMLKKTSIRPPYQYTLSRLEQHDKAADINHIYTDHVQRCFEALELGEDEVVPHNVILTARWIMTIPRRAAGLGAATANAAGFMGLVWVPTDDVVQLWKDLGPTHVLAELGVPSTLRGPNTGSQAET